MEPLIGCRRGPPPPAAATCRRDPPPRLVYPAVLDGTPNRQAIGRTIIKNIKKTPSVGRAPRYGNTVTVIDALGPSGAVAVICVEPTAVATAVTRPVFGSTVATVGSALDHVTGRSADTS